MSGYVKCICGRKRGDLTDMVVQQRNCNHSAFNGYKWTYSRYSAIRCTRGQCYGHQRTTRDVSGLPDDTRNK